MVRGPTFFSQPKGPGQRRYEALRAFFLKEMSAVAAAKHFGYTAGSFRVMCTRFRAEELAAFPEIELRGRPRKPAPAELLQEVQNLRGKNLDIYEIEAELRRRGMQTNYHQVWRLLRDSGTPRLPKRRRDQRPNVPSLPNTVADVQELDLTTPRTIQCRAPLLFLFAPLLQRLDLESAIQQSKFPSTSMIPAISNLRSLLALKILNRPRKNHVMEIANDDGLGLFAGLNVLPKTTTMSAYSYRVGPKPIQALQQAWVRGYAALDPLPTKSFNLDFHTIRHYGDPERSRLEKNYVPRRSQSVPSVLTVFAQEHASRTLVYADANLAKREKNDQVIAFAEYWKNVTGEYPEEIVCDAQGTTHAGLAKLNALGIRFLTLRQRKPREVQRVLAVPAANWKRVKLDAPNRKWRNPNTLDEMVTITDYPEPIRQIALQDLGREEPTLLLTNDTRRGPAKLFERYTQRTPIENSIGEQVGFFHLDALSSDVRLKVDLDIVLSVIASNCYHWLGRHLKGYETATAATIWRTFLDRAGHVRLTNNELVIRVRRFAKAPVLLESETTQDPTRVPWLGNRKIRLELAS